MSEPMHDTSLGLTGRERVQTPRKIIQPGEGVLAFALEKPGGTVNVHVIRPGRPPLVILHATLLPLRKSEP